MEINILTSYQAWKSLKYLRFSGTVDGILLPFGKISPSLLPLEGNHSEVGFGGQWGRGDVPCWETSRAQEESLL